MVKPAASNVMLELSKFGARILVCIADSGSVFPGRLLAQMIKFGGVWSTLSTGP